MHYFLYIPGKQLIDTNSLKFNLFNLEFPVIDLSLPVNKQNLLILFLFILKLLSNELKITFCLKVSFKKIFFFKIL